MADSKKVIFQEKTNRERWAKLISAFVPNRELIHDLIITPQFTIKTHHQNSRCSTVWHFWHAYLSPINALPIYADFNTLNDDIIHLSFLSDATSCLQHEVTLRRFKHFKIAHFSQVCLVGMKLVKVESITLFQTQLKTSKSVHGKQGSYKVFVDIYKGSRVQLVVGSKVLGTRSFGSLSDSITLWALLTLFINSFRFIHSR